VTLLATWGAAQALAELAAENQALRARVAALLWNRQLNCPRREAIEDAWAGLDHDAYALLFFDLDGLNAANYAYGYAGVGERIASVWDGLRANLRAGDIHGQWLGGDEFLIAVPHADAAPLAARVQALLQLVELSASRVIVAAAPDLAATVGAAELAMKAARCGARGEGRRGVLVDLRERSKELGSA
jgi:GGDEF domain-containing protein